MICYVCEKEIVLPPQTFTIFTCPHCKRNIIGDGSESERVSSLEKHIKQIEIAYGHNSELIAEKLYQANAKIQNLLEEIKNLKCQHIFELKKDIENFTSDPNKLIPNPVFMPSFKKMSEDYIEQQKIINEDIKNQTYDIVNNISKSGYGGDDIPY